MSASTDLEVSCANEHFLLWIERKETFRLLSKSLRSMQWPVCQLNSKLDVVLGRQSFQLFPFVTRANEQTFSYRDSGTVSRKAGICFLLLFRDRSQVALAGPDLTGTPGRSDLTALPLLVSQACTAVLKSHLMLLLFSYTIVLILNTDTKHHSPKILLASFPKR